MSITINGSGPVTGSDRAKSGVNSDITSLSSIQSINGGQLAGMRNRIINGDCNIAQRGSLVATSGVVSYGGPDRFVAANYAAGGQFTQSQSSMVFEGRTKKTVRQAVNTPPTNLTGTNYWTGIRQIIEGYNCSDLNNKPYTVSFIFNSNVTGVFTIALASAGSAVSFYISIFSVMANTPTRVSVLIPANTITSVFSDNLAGIFVSIGTISQGTYQSSLLNSWTPSTINSATTATNWAATAGNFIELAELQLEEGTVATPFERRSYGFELALCQRYYQTGYISGCGDGVVAWATASTTLLIPMRATPSLTVSDNIGQRGYCSVDAVNGIPAVAHTTSSASVTCRVANYVTSVNTFIWFNYTASAEL